MTLNIRTINDTGVIVKAIATCKDNNHHQVIIPRDDYRLATHIFVGLGVKTCDEMQLSLLQFFQHKINQPNNGYSHQQVSIS